MLLLLLPLPHYSNLLVVFILTRVPLVTSRQQQQHLAPRRAQETHGRETPLPSRRSTSSRSRHCQVRMARVRSLAPEAVEPPQIGRGAPVPQRERAQRVAWCQTVERDQRGRGLREGGRRRPLRGVPKANRAGRGAADGVEPQKARDCLAAHAVVAREAPKFAADERQSWQVARVGVGEEDVEGEV